MSHHHRHRHHHSHPGYASQPVASYGQPYGMGYSTSQAVMMPPMAPVMPMGYPNYAYPPAYGHAGYAAYEGYGETHLGYARQGGYPQSGYGAYAQPGYNGYMPMRPHPSFGQRCQRFFGRSTSDNSHYTPTHSSRRKRYLY